MIYSGVFNVHLIYIQYFSAQQANTCSKLPIKTYNIFLGTCSSVFIIYFEQVSAYCVEALMMAFTMPLLGDWPGQKFELLEIETLNRLFGTTKLFHVIQNIQHSVREKCPNKEFFLVRIFPYSDWISLNIYCVSLRIQSEYGKKRNRKNSVFGHFSSSNYPHHFPVFKDNLYHPKQA